MAHTYDVTFKSLFRGSHGILSRLLFGDVVDWPNVELPKVRNLRADLLARSADGSLRHAEIQLTNDESIPFRMLEYFVDIRRLFGQPVQQIVLYAGRAPMRMAAFYAEGRTRHEFTIHNLGDTDGAELLASDDWADNEFALLTKADREEVIRVVFDKLRTLTGAEQEIAASTFVIIGGILEIEDQLIRRLRTEMIDIMQNKVLGPAIRQGLEQGLQQGREEGREEGRRGMARMLTNVLEKRFGTLPPWAAARLASASPETLDFWSLRLDDSAGLQEILS